MEIIFFVVILIAVAAGFWLILRTMKNREPDGEKEKLLLALQGQVQGQLNELNRTIEAKLETKFGESTRSLQNQLQHQSTESAKIIKDITQELTRVSEGQKQVMNVTGELKGLQDILKNPKQRGVLGEFYLETILGNVLPPGTYQTQYLFKDGTKVDAVILYQGKIIPIDSKFSLENYTRLVAAREPAEKEQFENAFFADIKTRIDETSKYLKPGENTMEFAIMYIPAQSVYDFAVDSQKTISGGKTIIEYAAQKNVSVSSPLTFYAILQTILLGLKQVEFNESVEEVRKRVGELGKHLKAYEDHMQKLGTHLGTSVNTYTKAYKELNKVNKDVFKISGFEMNTKPLAIEGPGEIEE